MPLIIEEASHCNTAGDHPGPASPHKSWKEQKLSATESPGPGLLLGRGLDLGSRILKVPASAQLPQTPLWARRFRDSFAQYLPLHRIKQI